MSNNYMKRSLIYGVRDIVLFRISEVWKVQGLGVMEMQRRTQQGNVYMNEKHRKAESENNNK